MEEKYMNLALKQAQIAFNNGDVPVGCVIVKNNKVIAQAHNEKELKQNAINHAEIIAIKKACKKIKSWHLDDCDLYTTMEPCLMCTGAIIQSRIKNIYYSIKNPTFGELDNYNKKNKFNINKGLLSEESETLVKKFFKNKRK